MCNLYNTVVLLALHSIITTFVYIVGNCITIHQEALYSSFQSIGLAIRAHSTAHEDMQVSVCRLQLDLIMPSHELGHPLNSLTLHLRTIVLDAVQHSFALLKLTDQIC